MSNSIKVQKAIQKSTQELMAMSTEEFRKFIYESTAEKDILEFPVLDTVAMLRES